MAKDAKPAPSKPAPVRTSPTAPDTTVRVPGFDKTHATRTRDEILARTPNKKR